MIRDVNYPFSYGPGRRLVWWYEQLGRKEDARKLTLRFAKVEPYEAAGYPTGYGQYRTVSNGLEAAREMADVEARYNRPQEGPADGRPPNGRLP